MDDQDIVREFLIESSENLTRLDNEIIELERRPHDSELLASIFRIVHTIKGTCGFFGFSTLGAITHEAETILSQLRAGKREVGGEIIPIILEMVDATRAILKSIEATGAEGADGYEDLRLRLKEAAEGRELSGSVAKKPASRNDDEPVAAPPDLVASGDTAQHRSAADSAIRVDLGLLDRLMNLVGELVLARNQILQCSTQNESSLNAASQRLNLITSELQEGVMKTRMQPIGVVWNNLPRLARDIAHSLGKQIGLELDGAETELDRTIIEAIKDPLTHLVRNCCDHGIERPEVRARAGKHAQGKIRVRAYHEGGQVNIEISDDGAGIDNARLRQKAVEKGILRAEQAERLSEREALHLIFHPGFSTAEVVSAVSGRGVGMDVVKSNIEKISGTVDVASRLGEGTTVRLKIPLTLAIIPGLVVVSGGERFVVPQASLVELIRLDGASGAQQIEQVHGTPVYRRRGSLLPIAFLNEVLRLDGPGNSDGGNLVVLQAEDRQFGLVVDRINDTQEIVVKPLGKQLKGLSVYAGATIMGDGKVALILDVVGIGQRSGVLTAVADQARAEADQKAAALSDVQRLLLFRAGSFQSLALPLSLVARLEEFRQSAVEHASGRRVVQYRDQILSLVSLTSILEPGAPDTAVAHDPLRAIVFRDGDHSIGLLVDEVLDVVEDAVTMRRQSAQKGLWGSAVVGRRVVDFLDLYTVLQAVGEDWSVKRGRKSNAPTILLAEASPFSRGLLRGNLEMAGYQVIEASNAPDASRVFNRRPADLLMTSLDLPPAGGLSLLETLRRQAGQEKLPAIALLDSQQRIPQQTGTIDFDEYQRKFDWEAMVDSVQRLSAPVSSHEGADGETWPAEVSR